MLSLFGCHQVKELTWEGAASRIANNRLFVKVESIEKLKETSPSIEGYIPKPVRLVVKVIAGDKFKPGQKLALKMSSYDLHDINVGSKIAVGLVSDSAFICAEKSNIKSWKTACIPPIKLKLPLPKQ